MIFCKSRNFLGETEDTLKSHVSFVNTAFDVELCRADDMCGLIWYTAREVSDILYMVGHTSDAIAVINCLHYLCSMGIGTQIKDVYLSTCSSKPYDENVQPISESSFILLAQATDEEKQKAGIPKNKFVTLDEVLEKSRNDVYNIHLCLQDKVSDAGVKMAHFLPMDECGLGFSPTRSELLLYNQKGTLSEKLKVAFEEI